jgi:hypothetical protein
VSVTTAYGVLAPNNLPNEWVAPTRKSFPEQTDLGGDALVAKRRDEIQVPAATLPKGCGFERVGRRRPVRCDGVSSNRS